VVHSSSGRPILPETDDEQAVITQALDLLENLTGTTWDHPATAASATCRGNGVAQMDHRLRSNRTKGQAGAALMAEGGLANWLGSA
jgi:hypothetical protein